MTKAQDAIKLLNDQYKVYMQDDQNPEQFLEANGFKLERKFDLEDTIYGRPRYEEAWVHYILEDGSVMDEEMEKDFDSLADWDDHLSSIAEAAYEAQTQAFHAGEGPMTAKEQYMRSWEQKQELHARPPLSNQQPMPPSPEPGSGIDL